MRHGGDIYRNKVNMDFSVNLSPLPLPGAASDMIASAMLTGLEEAINYPDPGQYEVRESLTLSDNVDFDCIYAGSGASELIMACIRAVNPTGILIPLPCYTGYIHAVNALYSMQTSDSFTENTHVIRYYLKKEDDYRLTGDILNHMSDNIDLMFLTDPWNPGGANKKQVITGYGSFLTRASCSCRIRSHIRCQSVLKNLSVNMIISL